jgi:hypothetical protein
MRTFSKSFWGKADPTAVSIIVGGLAVFFVAVIALAVNDLFLVADIPMYWAVIYFVLVFIAAENKIITALGKRYFLLIADELVPGTILTVVFFWIIVCSSAGIIISRHTEMKDVLWLVSFGLSIFLTILILFVNRYVVRNKITIINLWENQIGLLYYTGKGNEIIFYEKPVWGKFSYSIIQLPKNWGTSESKVKFLWKHEGISNRMVIVPVTINFYFSGQFKAQDYGNFLPIQLSANTIDLATEIEKIFLDSVFSKRTKIFTDLQNYLEDRITPKAFMDNLLDSCEKFPKKMFSNSKKIIIKLGNPEIAFERRIIS